MKISLNWIFDHINGELSRIDVPQLVDTFIKKTAEIEEWKKVSINPQDFTLIEVAKIGDDAIHGYCQEHKKEFILPKRTDADVGKHYIIALKGDSCEWATSVMFGGTKEMIVPAVHCAENMRAGGWKTTIELHDYIIDVDNKSINNRPDLWGHRGLAREIAAILNVPFRSFEEFIVEKDVTVHKNQSAADTHNPYAITIQATDACDRFAALYLPTISWQASDIAMMIRLSRLDSRAIDFLVDATNYVMLDLGQPMHAFDAGKLKTKDVSISYAQDKEKLLLLDGETIELTSADLVIADGNNAVSLAGIMGGAATGISSQTTCVLLESAHFDPVIIRRAAAWHKKRTEASTRFEKSLDPSQNIDAIKRFLCLLNAAGIVYAAADAIISLGECHTPIIITVKHVFIEARLGILLQPETIVEILGKIGFGVTQSVENSEMSYIITVPSFRATKDIKIPEDIVEEVGRFVGYDLLPRVMPALPLRPVDLHRTYTIRAIKHFLSYGLQMRELYGYAFFDESVLRELAWQPTEYVDIKNPISENYTRLVTTLQPHLMRAVGENSVTHHHLRFYEWGRVWKQNNDIIEQKSLSGIFFEPHIDFYVGKQLLMRLFDQLHMNVVWQPVDGQTFPWYAAHQVAHLMHEGRFIGMAGMVEQSVINLFSPAGGAAFIFELNADYLVEYRKPLERFSPLSKYQSIRRDVSIFIDLSAAVDMLVTLIKNVDARIEHVTLLDFFTKSEWKDQKAMTFHIEMCDKEKMLAAHEVEGILNAVVAKLQEQGARIR